MRRTISLALAAAATLPVAAARAASIRGRLYVTDGVTSIGAPPHSLWVLTGTDPVAKGA